MKIKKTLITILIIIISILFFREGILKIIYPLNYKETIMKYSDEYNLDPYLIMAIIKTESNFQKDVVSHKQAYGLMQLTEPTATWVAGEMKKDDFKNSNLFNVETNIEMGCWYLDNLREEFQNVDLVLASYNAGRGNVNKWLKDSDVSEDGENLHNIPFGETDKYIKKVKVNYNIYKFLYASKGE